MTQTIAALATPAGGAIGIVRLSGPQAGALLRAVFTPAHGGPMQPGRLTYGTLTVGGRLIDRPMAVWMPAPRTYTGEDMAELHCHGSAAILAEVMAGLIALGAHQAGPGAFTRRAFLGGKLDLFEAEAVNDLVCARSPQAAANAAAQLGGHISQEFSALRDRLIALCAQFLAVIDYPDEEIDDLPLEQIGRTLSEAAARLDDLRASYERGRALAEGLPCAIIGRPNAGKSTLLNALLGYDRAIVTDIAGTTRDTVEETVRLGALVLRLQDTAGLRETDDPVERIGVQRALAAVARARADGIVLAVFDGAQPLTEADRLVMEQARGGARSVAVLNKADLCTPDPAILGAGWAAVVPLSAKARTGLDALTDTLTRLTGLDGLPHDGGLITNLRQADILRRTADALTRARDMLAAGLTPDAVVSDVEQAVQALGGLTGADARTDIVDHIFSNFCVGK